MISLIVFALTVFGIAYGIGHTKASLPFRRIIASVDKSGFTISLLECPFCLGTHLGWIAFLLHLTPPVLTSWWVAAFFSATTSLLLGKYVGLLDESA